MSHSSPFMYLRTALEIVPFSTKERAFTNGYCDQQILQQGLFSWGSKRLKLLCGCWMQHWDTSEKDLSEASTVFFISIMNYILSSSTEQKIPFVVFYFVSINIRFCFSEVSTNNGFG